MQNIRQCLLAFLSLTMGCAAYSDRTATTATAPATREVVLIPQPHYGWFLTTKDKAMVVAVTKLTIPDVLHEQVREIYLAPEMPLAGDGGSGAGPIVENADGANAKGGFGYNGFIGVADNENENAAIFLDVEYSWTTAEQLRGKLDEKVPVKIGVPVEVDLPGGSHLSVSWRTIGPA